MHVWDFTCSDTPVPSHLLISSSQAGKVADHAEQAKLSKYAALEQDFEIIPIGKFETLGPWGSVGLQFIQEIGQKIAVETREQRSTVFLFQAIEVAIQRGNAASVLGTVAKRRLLEEVYYL